IRVARGHPVVGDLEPARAVLDAETRRAANVEGDHLVVRVLAELREDGRGAVLVDLVPGGTDRVEAVDLEHEVTDAQLRGRDVRERHRVVAAVAVEEVEIDLEVRASLDVVAQVEAEDVDVEAPVLLDVADRLEGVAETEALRDEPRARRRDKGIERLAQAVVELKAHGAVGVVEAHELCDATLTRLLAAVAGDDVALRLDLGRELLELD